MSWLVIGVSPGPASGVVAFYGFEIGPATIRVVQCDRNSAPFVVRALLNDAGFRTTPRILAVQVGGNLIGALREVAEDNNVEFVDGNGVQFVYQPAGVVKSWATDKRLAAAGLFDSTKDMGYAKEAARHALYAAVRAGLLPEPAEQGVGVT